MSKFYSFLCFLVAFGMGHPSFAQTFRNNDISEENHVVSPLLGQSLFVANPQSITCGQFNDDNGDGLSSDEDFADCVTLQENLAIASPDPEPAICTLLNTATQNGAPNQFNEGYEQTSAGPITFFSGAMGSIRSGALSGAGFGDLVALVADNFGFSVSPPPLALRTIANADFTTNTGVDCTVPTPPTGVSTEAAWQLNSNEKATLQGDAERGMELFDCDGDGDLDSVTGSSNNSGAAGSIFIDININDGSGLQDILAAGHIDTTLLPGTDDFIPTALDTGDFNGDGILDVAVADDASGTDAVAICYGDGSADACGFTCSAQVDLEKLTGNAATPTSIKAADFNGDGTVDLAVVLSSSDNLGYLFNNGSTAAIGPNFSEGVSQLVNTQAGAEGSPYAVTAGFFNNDDVPDAVVSNRIPTFTKSGDVATLAVILSDGSGGLLPVEILNFPVSTNGDLFGDPDAVAAADFDHCGGDDIVTLAENLIRVPIPPVPIKFGSFTFDIFKYAYFWYNADEPPVVSAVTPLTGELDTPIAVTATCSDPTQDARTFNWTIVGPAGSNSSITPASGGLTGAAVDIAGAFQGDTPGNYTLTLDCSACDLSASTTVVITLSQAPPSLTQGGCLASLSGTTEAPLTQKVLGSIAMLAPILFLGMRRFKRA